MPRSRLLRTLLPIGFAAATATAACLPPAPVPALAEPVRDPVALPARLADTGLYADFEARVVDPSCLPFSPQYPLWSDGARKRRWIHLPAGTAIDASDPDAWDFPVGTKLWKEFAFDRPVETRYLERLPGGSWLRATYLWNEDGSDAVLAPEAGVRSAWRGPAGERFDVPARIDCGACHDAGPSAVLGFSALQLSADRDPLAPGAEAAPEGAVDVGELVRRGLVRGLPAELAEARIVAETPRERAALGYLHGNCGHCHTARGELAELGLALDYPLARDPGRLAPALESALGRPSVFRPPGGDGDERRIAPGDPEHSVLVLRMRSRNPLLQMPPLGTQAADRTALERVETWIREDLASRRKNDPRLALSDPR